jgi:hypothetical protein
MNADQTAGDPFETIDPIYLKTDVASLIGVRSAAAVFDKRREIINRIWKGRGLPTSRELVRQPHDRKDVDFPALRTYDRLAISSELGFRSVALHLEPDRCNGRLMIFHQGHNHDWRSSGGRETVDFFLDRGYCVLIFTMPYYGENTGAILRAKDQVLSCVAAHNAMGTLESPDCHPLKFFLDPIAIALNHLIERQPLSDIGMIGISGGGWTTHLYAALDVRIRLSFAVAGSVPMYLRAGCHDRDRGDWEQDLPSRIDTDYLDLYVLAASGDRRRHVQILNKYDSCCFGGVRHRTYDGEVKKAVAQTGSGDFSVFLDDSHRDHVISANALTLAVAPALPQ